MPEKHRYEFKQNGVSIFRFDLDTGESCWLQLAKQTPTKKTILHLPCNSAQSRPLPGTPLMGAKALSRTKIS